MKEENIKKLIEELFAKKVSRTSYSGTDIYKVFAIEEVARNVVEDIIRNYISEDREVKLGVLEAKVFAYEQIISKSNFAVFVDKDYDMTEPKPTTEDESPRFEVKKK